MKFLDPMNNYKINVNEIYNLADPFNHDSITFSMFILATAGIKFHFNMEEVSLIQFTNLFEKE